MKTKHFVAMMAILVVSALFLPWVANPWVYEVYFDQITEGMTENEVHDILAKPPGDYRSSRNVKRSVVSVPPFVASMDVIGHLVKEGGISHKQVRILEMQSREAPKLPAKINWQTWWENNWELRVAFNEKGVVIRHELWELDPPSRLPEFIKKILWYLGL